VSIHINMSLTSDSVGVNFFICIVCFSFQLKFFPKRQKVSVFKMRLGRMTSTISGDFSTGKSKELAARTSGSAHSLCQELALQIVKCSLLNIILIA